MASPYVLPSSALPHAHQQHMHSHSNSNSNSHSNSHSHSHAHSQSQPNSHSHLHSHSQSQSQSSLNAWRASMSTTSLHSHHEDEVHEHDGGHGHDHDHDHGHEHGHGHGHGHARGHSHTHSYGQDNLYPPNSSHVRSNSQTSNNSASISRERLVPASLSSLDGWTQERTPGGKHVLTPSFDSGTSQYSPPAQLYYGHRDQHDHHDHDHQHEHDDHHDHHHDHKHDHKHDHDHDHDHDHNHDHSHHHHPHDHDHKHGHETNEQRSLFTRMLLPYTAKLPVLHAVMTEKDSRRIFYFMTLNFSFMLVQAFYGYVTDSLGLLSDSIHMFFDCVALLVGLFAAVLSKYPPSQRFPYGFGKIETLSGFANGVLLMLLSVEIAFEAFERLWEGTETKRLGELFIVSSMGLAVNMVGMMAFGHHHHHGHDHGHSHGHDHDEKSGGCGGHGHAHGHDHDNENMHGIYLHVLADTLGSVSVIVSTVLTHFWGWSGWDPLASCLIAVLIFLSSQPLVASSARRLLLSVNETAEYNLRNSLGGILQQRGVVSYAAPKFWMDDRNTGSALVGVVHVVVSHGVAMDDMRDKVRSYLLKEGIDAVVQVEREGDNSCWCVRSRGQMAPSTPSFKSY